MARQKNKGSGSRRGGGKSSGRSSRSSRSGGDHRHLRVGEMIRKEIVDILASGAVHDPGVQGEIITVTEVRPTQDLSNATVFVAPLGGEGVEDLMAGLERSGGLIRSLLAKQISIRHVPTLQFRIDTSFAEADRIDALLASPKVARDLAAEPDDGQDE